MDMNSKNFRLGYHISLLLFISSISYLTTQQACKKTCGNIQIRYPFGTGPGCGDPRFQSYVTCNQGQLRFSTHSGCYPVTSIDYTNQVLYITDPTMSTCYCSQPSKGFSLDWNAPFSFHDSTVFALLDCCIPTSTIYSSSSKGSTDGSVGIANNSSFFPMCDPHGADICNILYSCSAISSRINTAVSSCCVYTPVDLGPSFEMDLQKLQCASYSGFYGFSFQETNPGAWKYGVALKYKFNYNNDYPSICANCEKTNGVCAYSGTNYNSFSCNCPPGFNTSSDCFYGAIWTSAAADLRIVPWKTGIFFIFSMVWIVYMVEGFLFFMLQ